MADVLGMHLDRAREILTAECRQVRVEETEPTGRNKPGGRFRVIRQVEDGDVCVLTVCRVPDPFEGAQPEAATRQTASSD